VGFYPQKKTHSKPRKGRKNNVPPPQGQKAFRRKAQGARPKSGGTKGNSQFKTRGKDIRKVGSGPFEAFFWGKKRNEKWTVVQRGLSGQAKNGDATMQRGKKRGGHTRGK